MIQQFTTAADCATAWAGFISKENEVANNLPSRVLSYCPTEAVELRDKRILLVCHHSADGDAAGFAFMTPPHRIVLSMPYPDDFGSLVDWLIEKEIQLPGVVAERESGLAFARCWAHRTQASFRIGHDMTIYELRNAAVFPGRPCAGRKRLATLDDHEELTGWLVQFEIDAGLTLKTPDPAKVIEQIIRRSELFIWESPSGEQMACTRRLPLGEAGCCVNFVYTPKAKRKQGIASQLVAEVSQEFLDDVPTGYCCLFTDNANPTSNSIYRKIGYREVAQFVEIDFK